MTTFQLLHQTNLHRSFFQLKQHDSRHNIMQSKNMNNKVLQCMMYKIGPNINQKYHHIFDLLEGFGNSRYMVYYFIISI